MGVNSKFMRSLAFFVLWDYLVILCMFGKKFLNLFFICIDDKWMIVWGEIEFEF